jgi:hypothetical protein
MAALRVLAISQMRATQRDRPKGLLMAFSNDTTFAIWIPTTSASAFFRRKLPSPEAEGICGEKMRTPLAAALPRWHSCATEGGTEESGSAYAFRLECHASSDAWHLTVGWHSV